jgi:hypothetical protein
MEDAIDKAQAEVTTALDAFERSKASLYRVDGSMKYSEQEHNDRLKVFTETLHGVAQRVDDAVEAELNTVRRLEEAALGDPVAHLTPGELATANARALFVREDAERLTLPQLLTRLRGVVAAHEMQADRVACFLWARYAGQRLAGEAERARAGGGPLPAHLRDDIERLDIEIARLVAVVAPQSGLSKPEAARRMKRARDARFATHQRVREADGTNERTKRELAGGGQYSF